MHCLRCPLQCSPRVGLAFITVFSCRASSRDGSWDREMASCAMRAVGDASDGSGGDGGGDGGFPFRAWNRGWRMAKMMAVAGVAISSAPVVVPPLLLASTVGAAFAVPFAVFFAGYALTERIMGSLLPLPEPFPSAALAEEKQAEEEETTAAGGGLEEGNVPALAGTGRWRISAPGEGEEVAAPARADEIGASSGEEIFCVPEVEEKLADVKQMEEAGDRETFIPILRVGREVTPLPEGEELLEETFPPADCSVLAVSTVKLSVLIESSSSSSEPTSSTEEQSSFPAEVESVVSQSRDDKGLATEETIWKQIDAIRMIAGSNRPPQPSCVEEVKALYLFVGIEPPISFEECSDLENVGDKLQFLKSIIGVK